MDHKIFCVIPARAGSKRIPKKNIKNFCGTPIITRAIKTALQSNVFNEVCVTTDDPNIAEIAKKAGASIPFLRPKELADDFTSSISVIKHFAKNYDQISDEDSICCLYATTPFIKSSDLQNAMSTFNKRMRSRMIFAAQLYAHPIQRAFVIDNEEAKMINPQNKFKRTQDLVDTYYDAGQFYIAKSNDWKNKDLSLENAVPLIMPKWSCVDIDDENDWNYSEFLYEVLLRSGKI